MASLNSLTIRIRDFIRAVGLVLKNGTDSVLYDGGTGLLTKVVFKEMALKALESAMRAGTPVSLVMADMDGLREINNTEGHQKGGKILRISADIIKDCLRESDLVGRYGGDEFIIVLPGTDGTGADIVVGKLKRLLSLNSIEWSFGVTEVRFPNESELHGSTRIGLERSWRNFLENLIVEADEDLYRDKAKRKQKPQSGT